jgi:hypothetical protein
MSRLTPEDLAQELIDQAWEAEDDLERVRLVLRALARSPDHVGVAASPGKSRWTFDS